MMDGYIPIPVPPPLQARPFWCIHAARAVAWVLPKALFLAVCWLILHGRP